MCLNVRVIEPGRGRSIISGSKNPPGATLSRGPESEILGPLKNLKPENRPLSKNVIGVFTS